jgi:hypothetical protein
MFVELCSRRDERVYRLGDMGWTLILKRIIMKWDLSFGLGRVEYSKGLMFTLVRALNFWEINRLIPAYCKIRRLITA